MIRLGNSHPDDAANPWRYQLDQFVKQNRTELSALAWGLFLERNDQDSVLGIDLKPTPRFVWCPRAAIETLNQNVDNQIQEILGVVDAHQPDKEVLIIGIGEGQLKLIQFAPDPDPATCYEQVATDVDTLLEQLEQQLSKALA